MPEGIAIAVISLIASAIGASVGWYVAARKTPKEMRVLDSQESENLATALNLAVQTLTNSMTNSNADRVVLEKRIDELEAHREMRSREIYTLQQQMEQLNREYAKQVSELSNKVKVLESQSLEWGKKYEKLKHYTEKLRQALNDAGLTVPEMDSDLLDTLDKISNFGKK